MVELMRELIDYRMENKDGAYQYLMDVTNSTTEDDIIPLLRGKSFEELMEINLKVATYLKIPISSCSKYRGNYLCLLWERQRS